ncbi:HPP family protein [Epibacterium ulvae]|uniref:HPP family protein n=1 Tax=Epibacterium ulvae TaxID=1156985 RepID=A0A1G5PYA9_9RHOB|nr:HPP family protein [Epibacterium ulvae]SCZ54417.1 HPP family protein [Epibacterium ulvae]
MKHFFTRVQPQAPLPKVLLAGLGGAIAIAVVALLTSQSSVLFIMAPFGATCVLMFSVAVSPLSQPANVIGGHIVATLVGLICNALFPDTFWALGLAVGLAISAMAVLRVTHPPAGANPLVVFAADPSFWFLLFPVASGAIILVGVAVAYHRATGTTYPVIPE